MQFSDHTGIYRENVARGTVHNVHENWLILSTMSKYVYLLAKFLFSFEKRLVHFFVVNSFF